MTLPDLTICICTYKRPWYALMTLQMMKTIRYGGVIKFHVADGGSPQEDLNYYDLILRDYPHTISVTSNLADMVNACAYNSGDVWIVAMDDFMPRKTFDVTPDVKFMLDHPEVGMIRYARLAFWGSGSGDAETTADLIEYQGLHWWRIDKARTKDAYSCSMGFNMYHRRFWDYYGNIPPAPPDHPGMAEHNSMNRYRLKEGGPTIAIPMRFPQDGPDTQEFIWHYGVWRTDEYLRHSTTGRL